MDKKQEKTLYRIGYVLILVCMSIPLFAEYVMDNPSILCQLEWVENRVQNPGLCGKQIWFWIPVLLRKVGISITTTYRISMFLAHLFSLGATIWFGKHIFQEKKQILFLTALYLLHPIYLSFSYEEMHPVGMSLWALIPLVAGSVLDWFDRSGLKKEKCNYFVDVFSLLLLVFTIWSIIGENQINMSQQISGYAVGQMFHTFVYEEGYPGIGLGIMAAVALLEWQRVAWKRKIEKKYCFCVVAAVICMVLASALFSWHIPAVILGLAVLPLSVLGTLGATGFQKEDGGFLYLGIPLMLLFTLTGTWVYLCNELTYTHMPLFLTDMLP